MNSQYRNQSAINNGPLTWTRQFLTHPSELLLVILLSPLTILLRPIIIVFLLPLTVALIFLTTTFAMQIYKLRHFLIKSNLHSSETDNRYGSGWMSVIWFRRAVAIGWYAFARIIHGYEVHGLDKIPPHGPAYLVYFHGTMPLDVYFLMSKIMIERNRTPIPVVDKFLFRIPFINVVLQFVRGTTGSVAECTSVLKRDEMIILSPGGVREALFSDEYYNILWGNRTGFAKVAIAAGQPIYPMFTENVREPIRVVQFGKSWLMKLYEKTRLPLVVFYGYFPCKLRTYIGDPIYPEPGDSPEMLADKVVAELEKMIRNRQIIPGNIFRAMLQRFDWFDKWFHSQSSW